MIRTWSLPLAASVALLLTGCSQAAVQPASLSPSAPQGPAASASAWPMLGRDAQRTGRSDFVSAASGNVLWSVSLGQHMSSSPAIGPDGTVYVGGGDALWALSPDGAVKWSAHQEGEIISSPAVAPDGTIYVGGVHANQQHRGGGFLAFAPDGSRLWRLAPDDWVQSSPALAPDGTIYFCCGSGKLYAVTPHGELKWTYDPGEKYQGSPQAIWLASPAIAPDGTIVYGTDTEGGPGVLRAVTPEGALLWTFVAGSGMNHAPAIGSDGTIYICTNDDGRLRAISPAGKELWAFAAHSAVQSSPAIGPDGTLYFSCDDGDLFAVSPQGHEVWKTGIGASETQPAIGADGTVYVLGDSLHAVSRAGKALWSTAPDDYSETSPAIGADGTLYVAGTSTLKAIGER